MGRRVTLGEVERVKDGLNSSSPRAVLSESPLYGTWLRLGSGAREVLDGNFSAGDVQDAKERQWWTWCTAEKRGNRNGHT